MVKHTELWLFAIVAIASFTGLVFQLNNTVTGSYTASGGGAYTYVANVIVQMQPDEACTYAGFQPVYPRSVFTNEYGTLMAVCQYNDRLTAVPLVQRVNVP